MRIAAVLVLLVAHNLITNLWLDGRGYVTVNLVTCGLVVAVSGVGVAPGSAWPGLAGALVVLSVIAWPPTASCGGRP